MINAPRLLLLCGLAVLVGWSVYLYPQLPHQIPTHFNAGGSPDRWSEKSVWTWFFPVFAACGTIALVYGMTALATRWPQLLNIPDKERFLALAEHQRGPVYREIFRLLDWVNLSVVAIFLLIQMASWATVNGGDGSPYVVGSLVVSPIILIAVGLSLPRIRRAIEVAELP